VGDFGFVMPENIAENTAYSGLVSERRISAAPRLGRCAPISNKAVLRLLLEQERQSSIQGELLVKSTNHNWNGFAFAGS
jgi:hypothetical protein